MKQKYTVCVGDLYTPREYELHLYQLRLIISAFNKNKWIKSQYVASTVAATWCETGKNRPLIIGFAATCIGPSDARKKMNQARKKFFAGLSICFSE
jgi:hypothetical protein